MQLEANARRLKIALLLTALMLCVAVFPSLPYAFFRLLKWVVCGAAVYGALSLKDDLRLRGHVWPLGILALLFNPLVQAPLTPLVWLILALGIAVYFLTLSKKI